MESSFWGLDLKGHEAIQFPGFNETFAVDDGAFDGAHDVDRGGHGPGGGLEKACFGPGFEVKGEVRRGVRVRKVVIIVLGGLEVGKGEEGKFFELGAVVDGETAAIDRRGVYQYGHGQDSK